MTMTPSEETTMSTKDELLEALAAEANRPEALAVRAAATARAEDELAAAVDDEQRRRRSADEPSGCCFDCGALEYEDGRDVDHDDGCVAADHGPGCDGSLNCTCGELPLTVEHAQAGDRVEVATGTGFLWVTVDYVVAERPGWARVHYHHDNGYSFSRCLPYSTPVTRLSGATL